MQSVSSGGGMGMGMGMGGGREGSSKIGSFFGRLTDKVRCFLHFFFFFFIIWRREEKKWRIWRERNCIQVVKEGRVFLFCVVGRRMLKANILLRSDYIHDFYRRLPYMI